MKVIWKTQPVCVPWGWLWRPLLYPYFFFLTRKMRMRIAYMLSVPADNKVQICQVLRYNGELLPITHLDNWIVAETKWMMFRYLIIHNHHQFLHMQWIYLHSTLSFVLLCSSVPPVSGNAMTEPVAGRALIIGIVRGDNVYMGRRRQVMDCFSIFTKAGKSKGWQWIDTRFWDAREKYWVLKKSI